ncbi:MAG TPA: hypothetical protein VFC95_02900 [Guyparkeria sp.]|nr:hypothetical protein [Guyparkeria sp.]
MLQPRTGNPMKSYQKFTRAEIARELHALAGQMERVANRMNRPDSPDGDLTAALATHAAEMRAAAAIARDWARNVETE